MPTVGFLFVRHGETEDNSRGVRCGGDRDVPLTRRGIADARAAAERLRAVLDASGGACGLVIAGPLERTRVTGALFAAALGVPLEVGDWLRERSLGAWNGLPIDETRPWLAEGRTPPGGESEADFTARVMAGLTSIDGQLDRRPLLVGSKGIGRVLLHRLTGEPGVELGNCAVVTFDRDPRGRWRRHVGGPQTQQTTTQAT